MVLSIIFVALAIMISFLIGYDRGCNHSYSAGILEGRKLMYTWMTSGAGKSEGWTDVDQLLKELYEPKP